MTELLDSLCKVVLKMLKHEKKNEDEAEESQFSVITSLETIATLLEVDIPQ